MPHEPLSNIGHICSECAPTLPEFDRGADGTLYRKVGFRIPDSGACEWMWVEVKDEAARVGYLENDPFYLQYVKHRDQVTFAPNAELGGRMVFAGVVHQGGVH